MLPSKSILTAALVGLCSPYFVAFDALAAQQLAQSQIAAAPPAFLRMDITSTCVDGGAVFKLINRGGKWPRTGNLRLYYADDHSLIGQRRLRLAANQRVSFIVKDRVMSGRPVAVWVEPEWYARKYKYDASLNCTSAYPK